MEEQKIKKCRKCGEEKSLQDFIPCKECKDGFGHTCKICRKQQNKKTYDIRMASPEYRKRYNERKTKNRKPRTEKQRKAKQEYDKKRQQDPDFKKYRRQQQIKYHQEKPEQNILTHSKTSANIKKIEHNITIEDIIIPNICPVLGIPIIIHGAGPRTDNTPSIDRIDNTKGYIKGNVRIISWRANNLKSDASFEEITKLFYDAMMNEAKKVDKILQEKIDYEK